MAKHKNNNKKQLNNSVTGDFELHFEDVVNRNRYTLLIFITGGLVLLALFVPGIVYYSQADTNNSMLEAESGQITNSDRVKVTNSDYIEFSTR